MRRGILALLFLVVLAACGSTKSSISAEDLSIVKLDKEKEIVSYGMSREEVDKVLGSGEEDKLMPPFINYDSGVSAIFRNGKIVLLYLPTESKGTYGGKRGTEIGMTKAQLKKVYGEKNAVETTKYNLNFYYDTEIKEFLNQESAEEAIKNKDRAKLIYCIAFMFDDEGNSDSMQFSDALAAYSME